MIRSILLSVVSFLLAVACSENHLNKGTVIPRIEHNATQCPSPSDVPVNSKILTLTKLPTGPLSVIVAEYPQMEFVIDGRQKSRNPDGKNTFIFRGGCSNKGFFINYTLNGTQGSILVEKSKTDDGSYVYSSQFAGGKVEATQIRK